MTEFETRKAQASDWFKTLRDTITARFEALRTAPPAISPPAGSR